jgi:MFS family permease
MLSRADFAMTENTPQHELLASACRKNAWRLLVILAIAYVINFLDRNSIAYAGLTMNAALGLTASQFGWAAGITILSYSLLEVPSNLIMQRVGARLWLSRIMISWGLVASAGAFVVGPYSLYAARLLLGAAEAGFFPGVIVYLSTWFPASYRTRVLAWFLLAIPVSSLIGGPLAALLLELDGYLNIDGWQWVFLVEGAPAVLIGFITYFLLVDDPRNAKWLSTGERDALLSALASEKRDRAQHSFTAALRDVRVLVLTVIQFGFTLATYGIGVWLPLILKEHGLNNTQIGLLSMPPYFAAGIGMLLWARFVDRNGGQIVNLTLSCLFAMFGVIGSVLFSELVPSLIALTIALIGVSSARAIFWTIPQRFLVGTAAAGGIAFINSVGLLGGFVGPFMMGWLRDLTGSFSSGLLVTAVILMIAAGFAALLRVLAKEPKAS